MVETACMRQAEITNFRKKSTMLESKKKVKNQYHYRLLFLAIFILAGVLFLFYMVS